MDLSKLSTEDLQALQAGDLSRVSTQGLQYMQTATKAPAEQSRKMGGVGDLLAGGVRGAGSIGATLLSPIDALVRATGANNDLFGPQGSILGRTDRREAMTGALQDMGADTQSYAFGGGQLGAEVAGTLGVGGGLANVARMLPGAAKAAPFLEALSTGGMRAGGAGMATRAAGGGVSGAASAGLVNPEDAGTGAAIGAALPGALKLAGAAGRATRNAFSGEQAKAAEILAKALDLKDPAAVAAALQRLQSAQELVPGSRATVAQALGTPQAGILQRVVGDSAGGGAIRDALVQQNAARIAALEGVAPTVPTGFRSAQQDMGQSIAQFATAADRAAKARTSALFEQVPLDDARMYLPIDKMREIQGRYFGPGSFGDRAGVDSAINVAEQLGTQELPKVAASRGGRSPMTLAQAVRKAGGISIRDNDGLRGEIAGLRGDLKNLVRTNGGLTPGRMAERMAEEGYIPNEDAATLFAALRDDATGRAQFSMADDLSQRYGAMRDAAMGEAPAAGSAAKMASLREVQNLRSSIGAAQRQAAQTGNDPAAAALAKMKESIDDRINEVVRGDGAIEENLPLDWADKLSAGLKSKRDQVQQFRTGPQAAIFRKGADGQPVVQGGEVAAKFWGARPGVADDVSSFRRLIDDKPELLRQFRSMVTTEGVSTADASGKLTSKFVRWVDNTLPGLKKAFEPEQVDVLQRIAQDIKRAEAAAAAGMSRGSNTYQNAQNALNLGLLDSPLLNAAANNIPVLGRFAGPALQGLRSTARESRAGLLAGLLADSEAAAGALAGASTALPRGLLDQIGETAAPWIYRSAPLLLGGR